MAQNCGNWGVAFAVCALVGTAGPALSQQATWVQLSTQPTLQATQDEARRLAKLLGRPVNGYALSTGGYALSIGPQDQAASEKLLKRLSGKTPGASISTGGKYRAKPSSPETAAVTPPSPTPAPSPTERPDASAAPVTTETIPATPAPPSQSRQEQIAVQRALNWFGVYDGSLDGIFGSGTRDSISKWQASSGYEPSGVLNPEQQAALMAAYEKERASFGMASVTDTGAGITIDLPGALVAPGKTAAPFTTYDSVNGSGVKVLLISQPGDQVTLGHLYDTMQSLEIVPPGGARSLKGDSFELNGENDKLQSYTYARTRNGAIKGFTLLWPAGDTARRDRVLAGMRRSFAPIGDSSSSQPTHDDPSSLAEIAGLKFRQPLRSGAGFFVDSAGSVLTASAVVQGCASVTDGDDLAYTVAAQDASLGLALLRPVTPLAPLSVAHLSATLPPLRSEVAVGGYPFGGRLDNASLTYGVFQEAQSLSGNAARSRLSLSTEPGNMGGPVLTPSGSVVGLLAPVPQKAGQVLPADVREIVNGSELLRFLQSSGHPAEAQPLAGNETPEALYDRSRDMTILVSCWE